MDVAVGSNHAGRRAGDWEVESNGETWSVRDDIFRASYEHLEGSQWRRHGTVSARPAQPGETIETLEGPTTAADSDWVIRGTDGEQWPVPADDFVQRYAECVPPSNTAGHAQS